MGLQRVRHDGATEQQQQNKPTLLSGSLQVEGFAWPLHVQKFVRIPPRTQESGTLVIIVHW